MPRVPTDTLEYATVIATSPAQFLSANMSRPGASRKQVGLFHFPGVVHFIVILIVTGIEIVGLIGWLAVAEGGDLVSAFGTLPLLAQLDQLISTVGRTRFAAGFLGIFLLIEHIISQTDQTGRLVSGREFVEILGFTSLEVAIWVVWLLLIPINGIVAFVFFLVSLFIEHQVADNVKKSLRFLHFSRTNTRVFRGLVLLTIFEVVSAVIWVARGSLVVLAIGSTLEHYVARNVGQIRE